MFIFLCFTDKKKRKEEEGDNDQVQVLVLVCAPPAFLNKAKRKIVELAKKMMKLLSEKQRNWFDTFNPIING